MATTARTKARRDAAPRPANRRVAGVCELGAAAGLIASLVGPSAAMAQAWGVETTLGSELTWTNNSQFGAGLGNSEEILLLKPGIAVHHEGSRLHVAGSAALSAYAYTGSDYGSRVLPTADLNTRLEAIERWFYLEAGLRALQTTQNPYGVAPGNASGINTLTTTSESISPYIEAPLGAEMRYRIRSDNAWAQTHGGTGNSAATNGGAGNGYFGRHAAMFEHDPRPLGWRLEAERSETRYNQSLQQPLNTDLARASVDYAVQEDLSLGLRAGYERNSYQVIKKGHRIYGAQAKWLPSERTTLAGNVEHRYFGTGWRLDFDHHMPKLAWNAVLSRGIQSTPQAVFDLPATDNVQSQVDAMFSTRYPDPVERARIVQQFIASQGLPTATLQPTQIYSLRLSLVTQTSASLTWTEARNTAAFSVFHVRTEDAPDASALGLSSAVLGNNVQVGASFVFSHRLTPVTNATMTVDWSRIQALQGVAAVDAAQRTSQGGIALKLNTQLSTRTDGYLGVRYRKLDSNVVAYSHESTVSAGLFHRF